MSGSDSDAGAGSGIVRAVEQAVARALDVWLPAVLQRLAALPNRPVSIGQSDHLHRERVTLRSGMRIPPPPQRQRRASGAGRLHAALADMSSSHALHLSGSATTRTRADAGVGPRFDFDAAAFRISSQARGDDANTATDSLIRNQSGHIPRSGSGGFSEPQGAEFAGLLSLEQEALAEAETERRREVFDRIQASKEAISDSDDDARDQQQDESNRRLQERPSRFVSDASSSGRWEEGDASSERQGGRGEGRDNRHRHRRVRKLSISNLSKEGQPASSGARDFFSESEDRSKDPDSDGGSDDDGASTSTPPLESDARQSMLLGGGGTRGRPPARLGRNSMGDASTASRSYAGSMRRPVSAHVVRPVGPGLVQSSDSSGGKVEREERNSAEAQHRPRGHARRHSEAARPHGGVGLSIAPMGLVGEGSVPSASHGKESGSMHSSSGPRRDLQQPPQSAGRGSGSSSPLSLPRSTSVSRPARRASNTARPKRSSIGHIDRQALTKMRRLSEGGRLVSIEQLRRVSKQSQGKAQARSTQRPGTAEARPAGLLSMFQSVSRRMFGKGPSDEESDGAGNRALDDSTEDVARNDGAVDSSLSVPGSSGAGVVVSGSSSGLGDRAAGMRERPSHGQHGASGGRSEDIVQSMFHPGDVAPKDVDIDGNGVGDGDGLHQSSSGSLADRQIGQADTTAGADSTRSQLHAEEGSNDCVTGLQADLKSYSSGSDSPADGLNQHARSEAVGTGTRGSPDEAQDGFDGAQGAVHSDESDDQLLEINTFDGKRSKDINMSRLRPSGLSVVTERTEVDETSSKSRTRQSGANLSGSNGAGVRQPGGSTNSSSLASTRKSGLDLNDSHTVGGTTVPLASPKSTVKGRDINGLRRTTPRRSRASHSSDSSARHAIPPMVLVQSSHDGSSVGRATPSSATGIQPGQPGLEREVASRSRRHSVSHDPRGRKAQPDTHGNGTTEDDDSDNSGEGATPATSRRRSIPDLAVLRAPSSTEARESSSHVLQGILRRRKSIEASAEGGAGDPVDARAVNTQHKDDLAADKRWAAASERLQQKGGRPVLRSGFHMDSRPPLVALREFEVLAASNTELAGPGDAQAMQGESGEPLDTQAPALDLDLKHPIVVQIPDASARTPSSVTMQGMEVDHQMVQRARAVHQELMTPRFGQDGVSPSRRGELNFQRLKKSGKVSLLKSVGSVMHLAGRLKRSSMPSMRSVQTDVSDTSTGQGAYTDSSSTSGARNSVIVRSVTSATGERTQTLDENEEASRARTTSSSVVDTQAVPLGKLTSAGSMGSVMASDSKAQQNAQSVAQFVEDIAAIYRYSDMRDRELDKLPCGVFHPDSDWRLAWDVGVLLLVCWYALVVPFRIAFEPAQLEWEAIMDWCAVAVFFVDILFNFSTAFRDRLGTLVTDRHQIAIRYLQGWFIIDFLATMPLDAVLAGTSASAQAGQINRLLRLARIAKLARLLRLLRLFPRIMGALEGSIRLNPSLIRFMRSIVLLLYVQHIVACGYYFVSLAIYGGVEDCPLVGGTGMRKCYQKECLAVECEQQEVLNGSTGTRLLSFVPTQPVVQLDNWLPHPQLAEEGLSAQYANSFWWAIQATVGVGADIQPRTPTEVWYSTGVVLVGIVLYSLIIGSASSALANIDSAATAQRQSLERITSYLQSHGVSTQFRRLIVDYLQHRHQSPSSEDDVLQSLPPTLRLRLGIVLNQRLMASIPTFQHLPAKQFIVLMKRMTHATFLPGEHILHQGDRGDVVFWVKRGLVDLLVGTRTIVTTLAVGGAFGLNRVYFEPKRQLSARAVDFVDILMVEYRQLQSLMRQVPDFRNALNELVRDRRELVDEAHEFARVLEEGVMQGGDSSGGGASLENKSQVSPRKDDHSPRGPGHGKRRANHRLSDYFSQQHLQSQEDLHPAGSIQEIRRAEDQAARRAAMAAAATENPDDFFNDEQSPAPGGIGTTVTAARVAGMLKSKAMRIRKAAGTRSAAAAATAAATDGSAGAASNHTTPPVKASLDITSPALSDKQARVAFSFGSTAGKHRSARVAPMTPMLSPSPTHSSRPDGSMAGPSAGSTEDQRGTSPSTGLQLRPRMRMGPPQRELSIPGLVQVSEMGSSAGDANDQLGDMQRDAQFGSPTSHIQTETGGVVGSGNGRNFDPHVGWNSQGTHLGNMGAGNVHATGGHHRPGGIAAGMKAFASMRLDRSAGVSLGGHRLGNGGQGGINSVATGRNAGRGGPGVGGGQYGHMTREHQSYRDDLVRKATFVVPAVRGSLLGGTRGHNQGTGDLQIRPVGLAEVRHRGLSTTRARARDRREESTMRRGTRMLGSAASDSTGGSDAGSMRDFEELGMPAPGGGMGLPNMGMGQDSQRELRFGWNSEEVGAFGPGAGVDMSMEGHPAGGQANVHEVKQFMVRQPEDVGPGSMASVGRPEDARGLVMATIAEEGNTATN